MTALQQRGRRTIVCELAGAAHVASAFGQSSGIGQHTTRVQDNLWCLSLDPKQALREWLRRQPGGAVADAMLSRSRAFAHFVDAAPGAKELITIDKVLELAGRHPDGTQRVAYGPRLLRPLHRPQPLARLIRGGYERASRALDAFRRTRRRRAGAAA